MKIAHCTLRLVVLLSAAVAFAGESTKFNSKADAYLAKLTAQEEFSGSVLIATNGNVVFAKGYGLANRELVVANATNTVFRLGSLTKQFTVMCILILHEQRRLSVTNLVSQYVEGCPRAWSAITVEHLLSHSSGIPNFTDFPDNPDCERLPTTVAATVNRFRDKPLEFEPGTKAHYSNSGYVLLGYVIEKVSGMTYDRFVAENIFNPLGMNCSGYDRPANILPNRASGYSKAGTNIVNCIPFAMDTPHAAGGLYSTVGDMLIWDQALYSSRLVSRSTLELMFTPVQGRDLCWGWALYGGGKSSLGSPRGEIGFNSGDRVQYWGAGGISGFLTAAIRFPKERVYVVVLSNFGWANSPGIAEQLSSMYFNNER